MFKPKYSINSIIAASLMKIESLKQKMIDLPVTPRVLASLRETSKLFSTHYSTMIEGNELSIEETKEVIKEHKHIPAKEKDEKEVLGYYAALDYVEKLVLNQKSITEEMIQRIHALCMGVGKKNVQLSHYRAEQNVIKNSQTGAIVYMPPEAKDVSNLMQDLVAWIEPNMNQLPIPIVAGIAHYQFATIHPYFDGNGRTARLLATLIMHLGHYGLKGIYSLDEYYAKDLQSYYASLDIGSSHNYYEGRAIADVTSWVEYFCEGVAQSFEKVISHTQKETNQDKSHLLRKLDSRQRKVLELFLESEYITSQQVSNLFSIKPRTARLLCQKWVQAEFFIVIDSSKKSRKYDLHSKYSALIAI